MLVYASETIPSIILPVCRLRLFHADVSLFHGICGDIYGDNECNVIILL